MRKILLLTLAAVLLALGPPGLGARQSAPAKTQSSGFAALIATLSETGGDFNGDNLISNEQSYLRVLPALSRAGVTGGAYLGVGPDQNLSYIAQVKPAIAFIIDIRRDNLLLHLLFKAIFSISPTRIEYLCALTGRAPPARLETWTTATIDRMIDYVDRTPALGPAEQRALQTRLATVMKATGVALSEEDVSHVTSFHDAFIFSGLSLVFQVRGRTPASYYPSLRTLLGENDGEGRQASFLAIESGYQFVRSLEQRDLVVPVVGDVSGRYAMPAIATELGVRKMSLSTFYISNVEQYLYSDGRFPSFVQNLKKFPRDARTTMIRSVFPSGFRGVLPQSAPDHYSTSITQSLDSMLADIGAGRYQSYWDLVLASAR